MNSGISDSDSGQNTKMAGLSQNQCPVYRGMTVRVMPESVSGLLRNMHPVIEMATQAARLAIALAHGEPAPDVTNLFIPTLVRRYSVIPVVPV